MKLPNIMRLLLSCLMCCLAFCLCIILKDAGGLSWAQAAGFSASGALLGLALYRVIDRKRKEGHRS